MFYRSYGLRQQSKLNIVKNRWDRVRVALHTSCYITKIRVRLLRKPRSFVDCSHKIYMMTTWLFLWGAGRSWLLLTPQTHICDSPIVGAGHELFFNLGMPGATIQHGSVALKKRKWLFFYISTDKLISYLESHSCSRINLEMVTHSNLGLPQRSLTTELVNSDAVTQTPASGKLSATIFVWTNYSKAA